MIRVPVGFQSLAIQQEYLDVSPVEFFVHGRKGIRLSDALQGYFVGLQDAESEALHAPSSKISYRVEVGWVV